MNRDVAERLAATEDADIRLPQARSLIATFLEKIAICSMCEGAKTFTVPNTVNVPREGAGFQQVSVKAGEVLGCLMCGGTGYDPKFVAWHCFNRESEATCRNADKSNALHAQCGDRVMLPPVKGNSSQRT